jgi:Putative conjugal transfer nickase/helicase TraI C-term/Putative helicase
MVKIFLKPTTHQLKSQNSKAYTEATLFPIVSCEKLLPDIEKKHYLSKIQEIITLPDDFFSATYEDLIHHFALFVQLLPSTYGEELGGLLNDGLRRSLLATKILHQHPDNPHPLLAFAVFSIALLVDIGSLLNYKVMISNENGAFIDKWHPHLGPMTEFGEYYKLRHCETTPQSLIQGATPILARQLLSETAITWLSSNDQIFDMWLAFLHQGDKWAGGLAKILKIDPKQFEPKKDEANLFSIDIEVYNPIDTDLGEKFLLWLKSGLKEGSIRYNESDSKVHIVKLNEFDLAVFLQTPELFQQFCDADGRIRDWVVVFKQFRALGLTHSNKREFKHLSSEPLDVKTDKLGSLTKQKLSEKKLFSEKQASRIAIHLKDATVVKEAKVLFGSTSLPVSQYSKEIKLRYYKLQGLPNLYQSHTLNVDPSFTPEAHHT